MTGWPTTLRFSRRLGETMRGADYACAIEPTPKGERLAMRVMIGTTVLCIFAALGLVLMAPMA